MEPEKVAPEAPKATGPLACQWTKAELEDALWAALSYFGSTDEREREHLIQHWVDNAKAWKKRRADLAERKTT